MLTNEKPSDSKAPNLHIDILQDDGLLDIGIGQMVKLGGCEFNPWWGSGFPLL